MCIATVDLPDPPFSFPTTITWTARERVALSIDMCVSVLPLLFEDAVYGRFVVKRY
jgi:hypothetical protein